MEPTDPIPDAARPKLTPGARLQTDKVTGKPILLYPEGTLLLNPTGQVIVSLCTGEASLEFIISSLAERYQVPRSQISQEVYQFLNRLRAKNLVQFMTE